MKNKVEPSRQKSPCPYCGDAPVSHNLFYFVNLISMTLDSHMNKVTRHAPDFLKSFADWLMSGFFEIFLLFGFAKLSEDLSLAKTFRSRVVWEEAQRRGIPMDQIILFGRPIDHYRAKIGGQLKGKAIYFNSLPIPSHLLSMQKDWDDKFVLKKELSKKNIPIPNYVDFSSIFSGNFSKIFSKLQSPIIVKPRSGSRGRHTVTNIQSPEQLEAGIRVAGKLSPFLIAEEHLEGDVCRATFVSGKLMGFYRGSVPSVTGDGKKTLRELILQKDEKRPDRVEKVLVNKELEDFVLRSGFGLDDVLPEGLKLSLSHRTGRLFGGVTREMLDELQPSFLPVLTEAARIVDIPVIGFDCIVPNPEQNAGEQKWGIIECNTLPYIDLHYYALEGKPKNIAGAIWDMWAR